MSSDRYLVVSSDGHAGPHASDYRPYVDPEFRDAFDLALPIQIQMTKAAEKRFLIDDINADWRRGNEKALTGAWDSDERTRGVRSEGSPAAPGQRGRPRGPAL